MWRVLFVLEETSEGSGRDKEGHDEVLLLAYYIITCERSRRFYGASKTDSS